MPDPLERIDAADVESWDDEADVVVVGFGAAGACAALGAREAGADVLVLERASGVSGTTTLSTGHFYLGGGTRPQRANGFDDTPDEMFRYLMANTPDPDEFKIRLYCDESVAHFEWLQDQGVPFNDGFYRGKHFEQPTDECLIWSGNEKAWPVSEAARPSPRGHKIEKEGNGGGAFLMQRLTSRAEDRGVRFRFDSAVRNLVTDARGRVVGLQLVEFGAPRWVRARRAVVLAAGGFAMNREMLETYCPRLARERTLPQGNPNDDGTAIQLGLSVGGIAEHMDGALITAPFYPPQSLLKGIFVNKDGQRFINEDGYHARTVDACLRQPDGEVYLICDDATFGHPELGMHKLLDAWEDLGEMEKDLGLPAGSLQATLAAYNEAAARGEDPAFHKHPDWLQPLTQAPFAALRPRFLVGFTLGGLRVSADGEVLRSDDRAIDGVYAAGACASNIAQDGAGYSSGTCIGEATFFGRRAGRHAAAHGPMSDA